MELTEILTYLVALNEGKKIVGKTRFQKTVFLLDQCGLESGSKYNYHYYGPFSVDIAEAAQDAVGLNLLKYDEQFGFHTVPYGTYELVDRYPQIPPKVGHLSSEVVKAKLEIMNRYSPIELELAATIKYLSETGRQNVEQEVVQLKPAKATPQRMQKAEELISKLGL